MKASMIACRVRSLRKRRPSTLGTMETEPGSVADTKGSDFSTSAGNAASARSQRRTSVDPWTLRSSFSCRSPISPDQTKAELAGEGVLEVAVDVGGVGDLGVDVSPLAERGRHPAAELQRCHPEIGGDQRLVEGNCVQAIEAVPEVHQRKRLVDRLVAHQVAGQAQPEAEGERIVLSRGNLRKGIVEEILAPVLEDQLRLGLDRPLLPQRDGVAELERRGPDPSVARGRHVQ